MQIRSVVTVGFLLLISFSLGYKRDSLDRLYLRLRERFQGSTAAASADKSKDAAKNVEPAAPQPAAPARPPQNVPPPVVAAPPAARGGEAQRPARTAPDLPAQIPSPTLPSADSLKNTLDSVRPTEMSDELRAQRNVYFDRLQQQLKEMREQHPADANPAAAPTVVDPGTVPEIPPPVNPPYGGGFGQQTGALPPPPNMPPGGINPSGVNPNAFPPVQQPGIRQGGSEEEADDADAPEEDLDQSTEEDVPDDEDG